MINNHQNTHNYRIERERRIKIHHLHPGDIPFHHKKSTTDVYKAFQDDYFTKGQLWKKVKLKWFNSGLSLSPMSCPVNILIDRIKECKAKIGKLEGLIATCTREGYYYYAITLRDEMDAIADILEDDTRNLDKLQVPYTSFIRAAAKLEYYLEEMAKIDCEIITKMVESYNPSPGGFDDAAEEIYKQHALRREKLAELSKWPPIRYRTTSKLEPLPTLHPTGLNFIGRRD